MKKSDSTPATALARLRDTMFSTNMMARGLHNKVKRFVTIPPIPREEAEQKKT